MSEALRFNARLPAHQLSVRAARAMVRALSTFLPPDRTHAVELVVSELVTNSIRYGPHSADDVVDVELVLHDDSLAGTVRDTGPAFPFPIDEPAPGQVGGFGLHIAASLSALDIQRSDHGNVVRFDVPLG
ncbi:MAG TPA: ATP-binding protein [Acidimicrobiales bacterium]|nr:ATP-binding protein [Acidimicrobiales bacterium]